MGLHLVERWWGSLRQQAQFCQHGAADLRLNLQASALGRNLDSVTIAPGPEDWFRDRVVGERGRPRL